jgi:hypothetical protein
MRPMLERARAYWSRSMDRLGALFSMRESLARAGRYTPEQRAKLRLLHGGALHRLRAARDLRRSTSVGAAAAIYREAALLVAQSMLFSHDATRDNDSLDPPACWQRLAEQPADRPERAQALGLIIELVEERDVLAFDRLPTAIALARLDALENALFVLVGEVEHRTPAELRRTRVLRITLAVAALLLALGFFITALLATPNVARGKPVAAQSYYPGSAPADALVNGKVESPWGAATSATKDTWFAIDLLARHEIERVLVYNRTDAYSATNAPFVVELSEDGSQYRQLAVASQPVGPGATWKFELKREGARWLRIRKLDARGLALGEVEVYGRKL